MQLALRLEVKAPTAPEKRNLNLAFESEPHMIHRCKMFTLNQKSVSLLFALVLATRLAAPDSCGRSCLRPNLQAPAALALSSDGRQLFAACARAHRILVLDSETLAVTAPSRFQTCLRAWRFRLTAAISTSPARLRLAHSWFWTYPAQDSPAHPAGHTAMARHCPPTKDRLRLQPVQQRPLRHQPRFRQRNLPHHCGP